MIYFRPLYDNLPIYGGFNKSKNTFGGFAELKTAKLNHIDNSL